MPLLTTIQEFCRTANDEQLQDAINLIQQEQQQRQQPTVADSVSANVQAEIERDSQVRTNAVPATPPNSLAIIKRQVYQMLNVPDTPAAKMALRRRGVNISELNLRTKSAWRHIWYQLQAEGSQPERASEPAPEIPTAAGNNWRPAGIEIEFAPPRGTRSRSFQHDVRRTLEQLERAGHISRGWNSELDASCGNEVVSPILYTREQFQNEVGIVKAAIEQLGGRASRKAGGHIHLDATGYNGRDYLKISRRYAELYSSLIEPQLLEYRRSNRYCQVTRTHSLIDERAANLSVFMAAQRTQACTRYRAVNGMSSHGTIEYRQGACILCRLMTMEAIMNWVDTLQAIHQHRV